MSNLFDSKTPRGIRNNNWLNIKYSAFNNWKGQIGHDEEFCIFSSPDFGIRAARKIMQSYLKRRPNMTLEEFICTWSSTDQQAYVNYVCRVNLSQLLPWFALKNLQHADIVKLFMNMAEFENGAKYFREHIGNVSAVSIINRGLCIK